MIDRSTQVLSGPHATDVIAMSCASCDARTTVSVGDPLKAEVVQMFRDSHAGHRPTVAFGRQLHV